MAIHGEFTQEAYDAIMGNDFIRESFNIPTTANQDSVALYFNGIDDVVLQATSYSGYSAVTITEDVTRNSAFGWITGIDGGLVTAQTIFPSRKLRSL